MFCTKCGNKLKDNQKFCSKCGVSVNNSSFSNANNRNTINVPDAKNSNPFTENETLAMLNNNIIFKELFNPSGRRNRKKYIIVFIVVFFIFYMAGTMMSYRAPAIRNTIASIVRCLMLYFCFVNLSKRLHDFNHTAGWAIPVFAFSYVFYYLAPPFVMRDLYLTLDVKFVTNMLRVCLVLTALPHVLLYFIKGTKGANQYGGED